MSLRFRLSLLLALLTLAAMALFAILEYQLFTRSQLEQLELVLERDLERAQTLFSNPLLGASLTGLKERGFIQQFVNSSGQVVIPPNTTDVLPSVESIRIEKVGEQNMLLAQTVWLSQTGASLGTIRVALDVSSTLSARRILRASLALSSLIIASLTVLSGLWLLNRALKPLRNLAGEARQIDPARPRMAVYRGPQDEVADLALALNGALSSIRERQEAERASLAEIAHELAAPLSLVAGHLSSLQNQLKDSRLDAAKDAADELLYTSQDLLTLARGELEQDPDFKICDLVEVLEKLSRAYPGVTLQAPETARVAGNPDRLMQMVRNLVRNAVQACGSAEKVRLELKQRAEQFELKVIDEGDGIAPEDLTKIFDRFFTKRGGVGVGLSVARRIAQQYGGDINAESSPGLGTTFTVFLPSFDSITES
ncbi:MAG: HAMP domain-containing histidine kinase [Trueperaceae bacterium]|nr:HAMP domain-containing histidine kinase [Trueperaceae bacterium]